MGIRQGESLFRLSEFKRVFYTHCHKKYGTCLRYWLPVLYADATTLNVLVKKFNIPVSPIWTKVGISGECMCMAGTPKSTLIRIIRNYPDYARYMAERDKEVQESRYSGKPAYPAPLYRDKITLHEFIEKILKESFITDYIEYEGKPCQGACIIGEET